MQRKRTANKLLASRRTYFSDVINAFTLHQQIDNSVLNNVRVLTIWYGAAASSQIGQQNEQSSTKNSNILDYNDNLYWWQVLDYIRYIWLWNNILPTDVQKMQWWCHGNC